MPLPRSPASTINKLCALSLVFSVYIAATSVFAADPLTTKTDIDFGRDVSSRNLKGLATRSDGRIVPGPLLTELDAKPPADLLWCFEPAGSNRWLLGTGAEGRIFEVKLAGATLSTRELAKLDETQVFSLKSLSDHDDFLAGTSPKGALILVKAGASVARVALPVDSIWDIQLLDARTALVATGNPGRIYRVDLAKFATAGINAEKITDVKILAEKGIVPWAEIRDRNVRRLLVLSPDQIIAGSSPHGTIYRFSRDGGEPFILLENHDAEVADLQPASDGGFYAALVFSSTPEISRVNRPPTKDTETPESSPLRRDFTGRSTVLAFPADGFPETLFSRSGVALYRLARHGNLLLLAGGEQGELLGYDIKNRLSLTFAGSVSSELSAIAPVAGDAGRFLLVKNNAPGFALADFSASGHRSLETRRLDLGLPSELGRLRFGPVRGVSEEAIKADVKVSNGTDEVEGWSAWTAAKFQDGAFFASGLRGHFAKLRITLPDNTPSDFEVDKAELYALPQNRRPILAEFRIFPPNIGIIPAPEPAPPATISIGQILNPSQIRNGDEGADKRKGAFFGSQVTAQPGTQLVFWTVTDPDGDTLAFTFSIRREGEEAWTDIAVDVRDTYAQFDLTPLADGVYQTRLTVTEQAPRPPDQRLTVTFSTDPLIIDKAPPEIVDVALKRETNALMISVHGRDARSLLDGVELAFNNGYTDKNSHPADGILDGRDETFEMSIPLAKINNATAVQVTLADQAGNTTARRVALPK